ncbi:MAG: sialidase family protein, partial [Thermoplasmata archaeon]
AGADPVVRAGTNGLLSYSGIVFDRGDAPDSKVFVARYIDLNNKEAGDPIAYVGTTVIDTRFGALTPTEFIDKPWMAVDGPRGSVDCSFSVQQDEGTVSQTVPAGNVYVAYTIVDGVGSSLTARILFSRSTDCGATFSAPYVISAGHTINQGAVFGIDPENGSIFAAWRRFASGAETDAILVARSTNGGLSFGPATVVTSFAPFQQGTTDVAFRTNAFPAMTVDGAGRVYLAWSARAPITNDGRIAMSTFTDAEGWSAPVFVDHHGGRGHQFMPTLGFNAGKLTLLYYDQRDDHTVGQLFPPDGCAAIDQFLAQRELQGDLATGNIQNVFNSFLLDGSPDEIALGELQRRHTIDVRAVQFDPAPSAGSLSFDDPITVSEYAFGSLPGSSVVEQLQVNPPN